MIKAYLSPTFGRHVRTKKRKLRMPRFVHKTQNPRALREVTVLAAAHSAAQGLAAGRLLPAVVAFQLFRDEVTTGGRLRRP